MEPPKSPTAASPSKAGTTFRKPGNYPPGHPLYQKPGAEANAIQPPASPTVKVYTPEEKMAIWTRLRKLAETHQKELLADIVSQHHNAKEAAGPLAGTLNMPDEEEKPADATADAAAVDANAPQPAEEAKESKEEKKEKDNFFAVQNSGGIRHRSTQAALLNRARNRQHSSALEPAKPLEDPSTEIKTELEEAKTDAPESVAPPEEDLPAPPQEEEDEEEEEAPLPQMPYYTSGESELDEEEEAPIDVNDVRATPDETLRNFPTAQKAPGPPEKLPSGNSNVAHLATSTEIRENQKVGGRRVAPQLESIKSVPAEQIEKMIKSFSGLAVEAANSQPPARQRAVTLIEAQAASEAKNLSVMANQELASLEINPVDAGAVDEARANKKQLCVRLFFQRSKERASSRLIDVDDTTRFEDLLAKVHAKATPSQAQTPEQRIKLVHIREMEKEIDAVCWLRKELEEQPQSTSQRKKIRETYAKLDALGRILASLKVDMTTEDDPIANPEMLSMYARGVKTKNGRWLSAGDNPLQILEQFQKGDSPVLIYAKRKVNLTISINQDVGVSAEAVVKFESFTFESSLVSEEAVAAVVKLLGMAPSSASLLNLQLLFPDTRWLEDGVPLYESIGFNPPASVSLSLRSRYFLERMDWVGSDPMAFQFIFSQAAQCVTSGNYNCSQLRATMFGALLVFVMSGSYSTVNSARESEKQILRRYENFLPTVLPQQYLATNQMIRVLAKDIRRAHELLGEFGTGKAMMAYLYLMKTGWMDSVRTNTKQKAPKPEKVKPKQPGCYEFFCTGKTKSNTNQNLSAEVDVNERALVLKKVGSGFKPWSCALPVGSLIGVEVPNKDQTLLRLYSFSLGSTDLTFNSTQERIAFSSCLQLAISKTAEIMSKPQGDMMMQMMTDASIYQSLAFAQVNFDNYLAMKKRVSPPNTAKLSIFIGTFNCGSNGPDNLSWVEKGHDIYVWGVQECNYKPRKPHTTCENDWLACLTGHLGNEYMVIKYLSMWEIRLVVMAKDVLMPFITNVEAGYEATGLGNVVKNKGGVAIALTVFDTSIAFFNCHLAARPSKGRMKLRNKNMQTIFHSLATKLGFTHYDTLNSFDLVYILGDLNYRVTDQSREGILESIDAKKYFKLFPNDQLGQQRACGNIAFTFLEAPITFRPSYRYKADCPAWSDKKLFNLPSYCDRVMWQARPTVAVNPVNYRLHEEIFGSDHRPVSSVHEVTVRTPVPKEPTEARPCVVRLYGLTFDLFQKEKSLAAKRHVLRRLILTSLYLREALEVHGECVDEDERAGSTTHSFNSSEVKKEHDEEVAKREDMVTLLPMPKGFCHTSRFFADEIITFPLGDLAPRDIDTASLVLTMFLQGASEPAGHAVIFLKDSCGTAGQTSAVPVSGYFTSDGLPLGCFSATIVTAHGDT